MIECFISHVFMEHRDCRYCHTKDALPVSVRKTRGCFNAFSIDCESCDCERNCSRKSSCKSFPIMCITESCPPTKKFYDGRCKLFFLHEKQIDFFEVKSDIKNYPDFEWHRGGISFETDDDEYEHHEWLRQFHTGAVKYTSWFGTMQNFYTIAKTILQMRKGKPEDVKPTGSLVVDYPPQTQVATGKGIPQAATEVLVEYQEYIEKADEPASVVIENENPIAVRDSGIAGDLLWALTTSKIDDDKKRRWHQWKSNIGFIDIAKSERPDLVAQLESMDKTKRTLAQKDLEALASTIGKQVKSMETDAKKSHVRKS